MRWAVLFVVLLLGLPAGQALLLADGSGPLDAARVPSHVHATSPDPLAVLHAPPERTGILPERYAQTYHNTLYRGDDDAFDVQFKCPTFGSQGVTGQEIITTETCPHLLRDEHDIMSQPTLMIEPTNPTCQAFHALHGGRGTHPPGTPQPPSAASRDDSLHQPHTVWRTCRGGGWADNPYYAPESMRDGRAIFGEDSAATQDRQGNMYIAGVLAHQAGTDPVMQYSVYVHRLNRINQDPGYLDPHIIHAEAGASIHHLQMAYVRDSQQIVVSWVEASTDSAGQENFQVRTWYSDDGRSGTWQEVLLSDRIGGCSEISEMVPYKHLVFVACRPAPGYFANDRNFTPTNVQVHAFDVGTWNSHHVAQTPLGEGHLKMIDGDNGWQILSTSGADPNGRPFALVTYGALGDRWVPPRDYADEFMRATRGDAQGQPLLDARITAAVHDDTTGLVFMVWALQYEIDPTDPATLGVNSLAKSFVVTRGYGGGFMASLDLNYGVMSRAVSPQASYQGSTEEIFWDAHDSIIRWRDPRGGPDRIFLALGDYGTVRVAEVIPVDPPAILPFPPAGVPAIPLAAGAPATSALSVALSAAMGLMLLRLLAAKKKVKVETPTI